jgi:hypothetical protein
MANPDMCSSDSSSRDAAQPVGNSQVQRVDGPPARVASDPDPSAQATTNEPDDRSGLDRAEAAVDSLAARLSSLASRWGRQFLRLASRARESIQDFWAEVQDFRRGKKP